MTLRQSLTGTGFLVIPPLLLNAISFPVVFYISNTLGPTAFGQWTAAQTLIMTATFLTNLGLRNLFVRSVSRNPETAEVAFADQLSLRLVLSFVAGIVALIACFCLGYPPVVLACTAIGAVGLIFTSIGLVCTDLFQALQKLQRTATINMISGLTLTCGSVFALALHSGPVGLAISYLLGPVTLALLSLNAIRKNHFPIHLHWNHAIYIETLKQARILGFQCFVGTMGAQAEALFTPKLVGFTHNGLFNMGALLSLRLTVVPDGVSTAFYPIISRSHLEGRSAFLRDLRRFFLIMLALTFAVVAIVFLVADPVAVLFFRKKLGTDIESIRTVQWAIRLTIFSVPLLGITQFLGYVLNATGFEALEARLTMAATLSGLALSYVLITRFGIVGACWSLVGRNALYVVIRLPFFVRAIFSPRPVVVPAAQPD